MYKWAVRLAVLTGILGVIGTFVIISRIFHTGRIAETSEKTDTPHLSAKTVVTAKRDTINNTTADKTITSSSKAVDSIVQDQNKPLIAVNETTSVIKQEELPNVIASETPKEKLPGPPRKITKQIKPKLLNKQELLQIVNRINKTRGSNRSNCVQIHFTEPGTGKALVAQVEKFLRRRRFIIAGREAISAPVHGVHISPIGNCVRLTIGHFD